MEWRAVSRDKALDMLSTALNCRFDDEGLRISAVSECLRSVLYQYSISETEEARQTVTSLRLTSAVRRKLRLYGQTLLILIMLYIRALCLY